MVSLCLNYNKPEVFYRHYLLNPFNPLEKKDNKKDSSGMTIVFYFFSKASLWKLGLHLIFEDKQHLVYLLAIFWEAHSQEQRLLGFRSWFCYLLEEFRQIISFLYSSIVLICQRRINMCLLFLNDFMLFMNLHLISSKW